MSERIKMKRHVGVINSTGARCIVVFRTVPGDTENCLVVETDKLSDSYHEGIINIVNSPEAQETSDFYTVLNRRTLHDGSNALQALHYRGLLRKIPVSLITLKPMTNRDLPLAILNEQLDGPSENAPKVEKAEVEVPPTDKKAIINGLTIRAEMLESEAEKVRAEIKQLQTELKLEKSEGTIQTGKVGRPALTEEAKAEATARSNEKRNAADREKYAAKKEDALSLELDAQVEAKILRDAAGDSIELSIEDLSD